MRAWLVPLAPRQRATLCKQTLRHHLEQAQELRLCTAVAVHDRCRLTSPLKLQHQARAQAWPAAGSSSSMAVLLKSTHLRSCGPDAARPALMDVARNEQALPVPAQAACAKCITQAGAYRYHAPPCRVSDRYGPYHTALCTTPFSDRLLFLEPILEGQLAVQGLTVHGTHAGVSVLAHYITAAPPGHQVSAHDRAATLTPRAPVLGAKRSVDCVRNSP